MLRIRKRKKIAMYLSHSQIELWHQCRFRWYLTKVAKVPQAPAEALVLGNAFHVAVERIGNNVIECVPSLFDDLFDVASSALTKAIDNDATRFLAEHSDVMHEKLTIMLKAFLVDILPMYHPISTEETFTQVFGKVVFTGRIDARTAKSIVDFKTGKTWLGGIEHTKDQATAYLMAYPAMERVTFIVFPVQDDVCTPQILPTHRTPDQIEVYERSIQETALDIAIAKQENSFITSVGPLCGWCSVLGSCEIGQRWLAERGRMASVPIVK